MFDKEHMFSQGVALFCIVFGALCMGVASHYNWPEMKTLGASISGAGLQAITSQIRNTLNNKDGGVIGLGLSNAQPEK